MTTATCKYCAAPIFANSLGGHTHIGYGNLYVSCFEPDGTLRSAAPKET